MKKRLSILLAICLIAAVTVGCGDSDTEATSEDAPKATAEASAKASAEPTVDSLLKEKLDSYEALANNYVSICERYFSAVESGGKIFKVEQEYNEIKKSFDEANSAVKKLKEGLKSVDLDYYKEVKTRVNESVAKVFEKHADAVQMLVERGAN